ncbi:MAG TPA: YlxR family protein [Mycobacteriales bacterium]|nr:YlxR family protein [Mycobacteriales bacterium]
MSAASTRGPVRTCVGCRATAEKSQLLRVVVVAGTLTPDPRGTLPGRGAHLHPDAACLALAQRRRAFPRALRVSGPLDTAGLDEYLNACKGTEPFDERSMSHHR